MRENTNQIKNRATASTMAGKDKCVKCNERIGILQCENGKKICETCAQIMSDLSPD